MDYHHLGEAESFLLPFVELPEIPLGSLLQPVKVLRDGNITCWCTSHSFQFCVLNKPAPPSRLFLKMLNRIIPSIDSLGTQLVTSLHLDFVPQSPSSRPICQPIFSQPHCLPIHPILHQLVFEDVLGLARTGLIFTGLQEGAQPGGGG